LGEQLRELGLERAWRQAWSELALARARPLVQGPAFERWLVDWLEPGGDPGRE